MFTGEGGDEVFAGYGRYRRTSLQRLVRRLAASVNAYGYRERSLWPAALRRDAFSQRLLQSRQELYEPLRQAWRSNVRGRDYVYRAQMADLRTELADGLLVKVDRMLMAFGLEGRVPFLDHRVVEFGLSLPRQLKTRGRTG